MYLELNVELLSLYYYVRAIKMVTSNLPNEMGNITP